MATKNRFKVRFKEGIRTPQEAPTARGRDGSGDSEVVKRMSHSRGACHNCRMRHVKCNELFPVCTQCRRRGLLCMPKGRLTQWQVETPQLMMPLAQLPSMNKRLVQYWVERASQIMVLDPEVNPLSFPIIKYLAASESLLHAIQCLSAAHENFFQNLHESDCLVERGKALRYAREELGTQEIPGPHLVLTAYLLGASSSWIEMSRQNFGQEHLIACSAMLHQMLSQPDDGKDLLRHFVLGLYIFWDMSCSLLVDAKDQVPVDTPEIQNAIKLAQDDFHPMVGNSMELFHELACLGRYCRRRIDLGECDPFQESLFEERLLHWRSRVEQLDPLHSLLAEIFRLYGLILLYRICGQPLADSSEHTETLIVRHANQIIDNISKIRPESPYFKFTPIPLLVAGAEIPKSDAKRREKVVLGFEIIFAINRLPSNFWAAELLNEHWTMKDQGSKMSWLELMLLKNWRIFMG